MAEYLSEIGFVVPGTMGATPLTWGDLRDWQHFSRRPLAPWEAVALIDASSAYLGTQRSSAGQKVPAPWGDKTEQRRKVSDQLRAGFAALMESQKVRKRR